MIRRLAAAILALTAAPAPVVADGWVGAGLGGGRDSNVDMGVEGATVISADFATARAWAGIASVSDGEGELSAELGYEATVFPGHSDLDLHHPSLTLAWATGDSTRVRAAAFAGWLAAADSARAGWDASASASLRQRLGAHAALRASAGYARRDTADPGFSTSAWNGRAGAEVRVLGATLWGSYGGEIGSLTVTQGSTGATSGHGGGTGTASTRAVVHGWSAGAWVPLGKGFWLSAAWRSLRLEDDAGDATRQVATAEIGWER